MNACSIVEYSPVYKQAVLELIIDIQTKEFNLPITLSDQPDLQDIPAFYQQGYGNFWLALLDNKVIGTIALIDINNAQSALRKMFVAKQYRGRDPGIAQQLLNNIIQWCKLKNIQEIYLGTVSMMQAAQRFYEKNGFFAITQAELPEKFPLMKVDTKFYLCRPIAER